MAVPSLPSLQGSSGPPHSAPLPGSSSKRRRGAGVGVSSSMPNSSRAPWLVVAIVIVVLLLVVVAATTTHKSSTNNSTRSSSAANQMTFPNQPIRIFGPSSNTISAVLLKSGRIHHQVISSADRFWFIQSHGEECWPGMVERYDRVNSSALKLEMWKYCVMYEGNGNVYQDEGISWFVDSTTDVLEPHHTTVLFSKSSGSGGGHYHGSFLQLNHQKNKHIARQMCKFLVEESKLHPPSPEVLSSTLYMMMAGISSKTEYQVHCNQQNAAITSGTDGIVTQRKASISTCALKGGYCCQLIDTNNKKGGDVILAALRHPLAASVPAKDLDDEEGDSGFISTITVVPTHAAPATPMETPNFFDILLQNDCLPTTKNCYKCLKQPGSSCSACAEDCGCYCKVLCHVVPPPKVVTQVWKVSLPSYRRDPTRLIPRLVHQTWFEPVTSEKYPNMSRLIESWKTSGWDYTFYDDATAAEFLLNHFPPAVRQAYDTILPGAFKADLFRYCVLFIKGGVYADMDVLLESNLNAVVAADIGFMVPIDEPGINEKGHRSCLWNGLLAVAPGHVILAQTIELVVNNIRNRFTSVDYDNMLCPNPTLSVSHTVDTLFTCGPCILGAAMNQVLGRHMQSEWELGEVDIWKSSTTTTMTSPLESSSNVDDPRHGIQGRTVILAQNKLDMGSHRFTDSTRNWIVATTDMPDYDDRPPTKLHYSRTHEKVGVYGLRNLYKDNIKANEEIRIEVVVDEDE